MVDLHKGVFLVADHNSNEQAPVALVTFCEEFPSSWAFDSQLCAVALLSDEAVAFVYFKSKQRATKELCQVGCP